MDYEKKYKEALERAKGHYGVAVHYGKEEEIQELEHIFPELKEIGENKKMKEMAIKAVHSPEAQSCLKSWGVNPDDVISWLEKQGEQKQWDFVKPVSEEDKLYLMQDEKNLTNSEKTCKVEPKFKVGDKIKYAGEPKYPVREIIAIKDDAYYFDGLVHLPFSNQDMWELAGQNPADKVEPKFKVGDWVVNKFGHLKHITKIENDCYYTEGECGEWHGTFEYGNTHFRLWTIQDAKDGDVLVASDGSILLFKCVIDGACKHYVALTTDNTVIFNEGLEHYWETSRAVHPATKEQRDLLFQKMKESGYQWDAEKKELRKIEQKSLSTEETELNSLAFLTELGYTCIPPTKEKPNSWSEEDTATISRVISIVKWAAYSDHSHPILNDKGATELVERLNSFKERYTWKPSDEQMEYLAKAITTLRNEGDNKTSAILNELRTNLKKLQG